ncbi:RagB/SusD family nutrient uptake outer membrane protein [Fodinibius sp. Rm-B-1B1-1]|uniref:RagB/SusD family nutrient uptake outer membrane protein n=1 Tax=Fodinibius alkaliphilus TaxID=3140241 RepID=UPI00315AE3DE
MNKNRYTYIYSTILLLVLLITSSCDQDLLNVQPTDRLADNAIWQDSSLVEAFVINTYIGPRLTNKEGVESSGAGFGRTWEYALWSSLTDESIYNNDDDTWLIQRGELSPANLGIAGTIWGRSYRVIRDCNLFLDNIDDVNMSESKKQRLTAEIKFVRAYRYHDLIRNYGEVPLMGDEVYQLEDNLLAEDLYEKASISEAIDYVVSELDKAAQNLPTDHNSNWEKGRATKGAALALKSRLLLYAASPLYTDGNNDPNKWQAAADAAEEVMNMQKYSLYPDYGELFLTPYNNSEIIFERVYTFDNRHLPLEIANGPNGYGGWAGNTPLQNLVDDYEMDNGMPIDESGSGYDPQNPYEDRDPRFYETILFNGAEYRDREVETFVPGGRDSEDGQQPWNTSKTGYYLRKFINPDLPITNPWNGQSTQPWIYIRYAEVLLNYAEAQNEATGPDASVHDAVNEVRNRVGMPDLPQNLTQSEMRERIRNERRIELAFEEHRFYDVRRWEIAMDTENEPAYGMRITKNGDGSLEYERKVALDGRSFEEKHYWLPIPREEIQASDGQLEQNPGY